MAEGAGDGAPGDLALDELGHRRDVEDAAGRGAAAEHDAVEAERLAHAEAEHAAEVELGPQVDEAADPDGGVGEVRGEEAGVDGADRGAAEDVEARGGAADAGVAVEHVGEDADLVGAARAAAREDDGDLLAVAFGASGGDEDALAVRGREHVYGLDRGPEG